MDLQDARALVQQIYNQLLLRNPDEPSWTIDANAFVAGTFDEAGLRAQILASAEYAALQAAPAPPPPAPAPTPAPTPAPAPAGFVAVTITAIDADDGTPIPNASVTSTHDFGDGATRTTDGNGQAQYGVLIDFTISITVAKQGYSSFQVVVTPPSATPIALTAPLTLLAGHPKEQPVPTTPNTPAPVPTPTPAPSPVPPSVPIGGPVAVVPPPPVRAIADAAASVHAFDIGVGSSFSNIIGNVISGLIGLFGGGNAGDINKLNDRVTSLGNFVLTAISALTSASNYDVAGDQIGGSLWGKIFSGIFGPIVGLLSGLVHGVSSDLASLLGPLTKVLGSLRDVVRRIYQNWLAPILKVIDTTRQVLRVLAALHLKLAAEADAALGRLEGKLTAPLLLATKQINAISNQVNRIVTLDGALQRVTLVQSLVKHQTCVQRSIDQAPMAPPGTYPDELPPLDAVNDLDTMLDNARLLDDDGGPWADDYAQWKADMDAALLS
jgi:hypothetical protein